MTKWIFACLVVLFGCFACVSTTKTVLKPGMPNTLKLSNGEVVYDLSGEWDLITRVRGYVFGGMLEIKQNEDRFVGTLKSGKYPQSGEIVKGSLKGGEITNLEFNAPSRGWLKSDGEIVDGGKRITISSPTVDRTYDSTLTKK
jgi:hypothetical protein